VPPTRRVPFTAPLVAPHELDYVAESLRSGMTSGDGPFTRRATALLEPLVGGGECLLTTSCTHALEMTAILLDLQPGEEVIMPSFTFVSTANAYALRGAVPVFVDVRPDTLDIDPARIEEAVTERTRAIVVVHYGGVACDMDEIAEIAERHGLVVIEDNAHGLGGTYHGRRLGSIGAMATQSFHVTKNVSCGEGGALVVNDPALRDRAEIIREKGTNRSQFFRGMVDKYRWVDVGSSYLPSDVLAAALTAQLEAFDDIQRRRHRVWATYHAELADWAAEQQVRLPSVPEGREHPAHVYQLLLPTPTDRKAFIEALAAEGITAPFHYVPLHSSPFGEQAGRTLGCPVTDDIADRLVRLPLFAGLAEDDLAFVIDTVRQFQALR
jgi:dTDP-4-amino-4,6-dideoxygalactose transaminase